MRSRLAVCLVLLASAATLAQTAGTPSQSTPAPAQATPQTATPQPSTPYRPPQAKTKEEFDAYKAGAALTNPDQVLAAADQFAQKYPESELKELLYVQAMNGFAQQNRADKEIEAARKAVAIDPHDPNPLIHVASALVEVTHDNDLDKEQRYAEAAKDAQAAIDNINTGLHIPPNVSEAQVQAVKNSILALAYETLGVIAMQKQDFAGAETNFQTAADISKAQPSARVYLRLSVAQDNEKKYAEALVNANKALQYSQQGSVEQTLAKQQQTRLQKLVGEGAEPSIPAPGATPPPATTSAANPPGGAAAPGANAPPPGFVKMPEVVHCSFKNVMQAGGTSTGGQWAPISVGSLTCTAYGGKAEQDVPLASGNVNNRLLATKSFGNFFVSGGGSSLQLYIPADQMQDFMQFLGAPVVSAPGKQ